MPRPDRRGVLELLGPVALIIIVALVGSTMSPGTESDFIGALVAVTIVVAIYVFVGNSGVISFGHIAFVALGAFGAGILSLDAVTKPFVMPNLYGFLADTTVGNVASLAIAAGLGAGAALFAGIALMRLSGLAAGIATFALLEITHNVLRNWEKIGPGPKTLPLVSETTDLTQAAIGAILACVVAYTYQRSRAGRRLRASREDPAAAEAAGIDIHRERLIAFVISGALAGLAGGLLVHQLGSVTTEQVYLELTFLTLAMLVVGGIGSLWGAVIGAVLVTFLDTVLGNAEDGISVGVGTVTIPDGMSLVVLGILLTVVLLRRPSGITGSHEFSVSPLMGRRRTPAEPVASADAPPTESEAVRR
jgi:branched-chain amino acid transport system permease protein